jgi:hypothetical protein
MLVEQHHTPFGLTFASEKLALDLRETEQTIISMDGFQNELVTHGKAHRRGIIRPLISGDGLVFFIHARSIRDRNTFVSYGVRKGLDAQIWIKLTQNVF